MLRTSKTHKILRSKRIRNGPLNFASDRSQVYLMKRKGNDAERDLERTDRIIEEFMIITNITVAEHFGMMVIPLIYRTHDS